MQVALQSIKCLRKSVPLVLQRLIDAGQWRHGVRNGKGAAIYDNGIFNGKLANGQKHGHGCMVYHDCSFYEGEWKFDKRHGRGTYTLADGVEVTGNWKNGKRQKQPIRQRKKKKRGNRLPNNRPTQRAKPITKQLVNFLEVAVDDLTKWKQCMAHVNVTFVQGVRGKRFAFRHPVQLSNGKRSKTVRNKSPSPTPQSAEQQHSRPVVVDGRASSVCVGVIRSNRYRRRGQQKSEGLSQRGVAGSLASARFSEEERQLIKAQPTVFRYNREGSFEVDLHGVYNDDEAIQMSMCIVQKLLSGANDVVQAKLHDKDTNAHAVCIKLITGKGEQSLYAHVKKEFECWRDKGDSLLMRRYVECK